MLLFEAFQWLFLAYANQVDRLHYIDSYYIDIYHYHVVTYLSHLRTNCNVPTGTTDNAAKSMPSAH